MAYKKQLPDHAKLVRSGTLRGAKYEIYSYPGGRSLSGPILFYIVKVQHGDGSWITERARTLRGAETKLDKTSQWNWRYENEFQKRYGITNPLSMLAKKEIILGGALLAGIVGISMILSGGTAAASIPPAPSPPGPNPSPSPSPPRSGTTTVAQTYTVTDADAGSTITMNQGDTLQVVLPINDANNTASYTMTDSNGLFAAGLQTELSDQASQPFIASASGSGTLTAQGVDASNNASGEMYTFNIVVN